MGKVRIKIILMFTTLMLLIFLINSGFTQQKTFSVESLLTEGKKYVDAGDYKKAKLTFKKIFKFNKNYYQGYSELGKLEILNRKWKNARKYFLKVVNEKPLNIEAKYYLGICFREIGRTKSKFLHDLLNLKLCNNF